MFEVLDEATKEESGILPIVFNGDAKKIPESYARFSHFILPNMTIEIYSYLEFWLQKICKRFYDKKDLKCDDIKGENDLHKYHKYFIKYLHLNIDADEEYKKLNVLREVRNKFIHQGGHINVKKSQISTLYYINGKPLEGLNTEFISINDINKNNANEMINGLITIEKSYILDMLDVAKNYLLKVVDEINQKKVSPNGARVE
jgi:hypothetical protein